MIPASMAPPVWPRVGQLQVTPASALQTLGGRTAPPATRAIFSTAQSAGAAAAGAEATAPHAVQEECVPVTPALGARSVTSVSPEDMDPPVSSVRPAKTGPAPPELTGPVSVSAAQAGPRPPPLPVTGALPCTTVQGALACVPTAIPDFAITASRETETVPARPGGAPTAAAFARFVSLVIFEWVQPASVCLPHLADSSSLFRF